MHTAETFNPQIWGIQVIPTQAPGIDLPHFPGVNDQYREA